MALSEQMKMGAFNGRSSWEMGQACVVGAAQATKYAHLWCKSGTPQLLLLIAKENA